MSDQIPHTGQMPVTPPPGYVPPAAQGVPMQPNAPMNPAMMTGSAMPPNGMPPMFPMPPQQNKNGGNGVLIGILAVLLVALLAVGSWLVWVLLSDDPSDEAKDGSNKSTSASKDQDAKKKDKKKDKQDTDSDSGDKQDGPTAKQKEEVKLSPDTDTTKPLETDYILIEAPSKNISCQIYNDRIGCSIKERKYSELGLPDCNAPLFSIMVDTKGVRPTCNTQYVGRTGDAVTTLQYGKTMRSPNGRFACSINESGMTCKDTQNNRGYKIAREEQTRF